MRLTQAGRGLVDPFGLAIAPNGDIYVAEGQWLGGLSGVVRIDSMLGTQTVVSEGGYLRTPAGIAIEEDGVLYVVDMDAFGGAGGVIRVEPESGAQSVVSFGGEFLDPIAIALTSDGELMVLDNRTGALISVDRELGAQRLLSPRESFDNPIGLATLANGQILIVDGYPMEQLVSFDPGTGTRSISVSDGLFVEICAVATVPLARRGLGDDIFPNPADNCPMLVDPDEFCVAARMKQAEQELFVW